MGRGWASPSLPAAPSPAQRSSVVPLPIHLPLEAPATLPHLLQPWCSRPTPNALGLLSQRPAAVPLRSGSALPLVSTLEPRLVCLWGPLVPADLTGDHDWSLTPVLPQVTGLRAWVSSPTSSSRHPLSHAAPRKAVQPGWGPQAWWAGGRAWSPGLQPAPHGRQGVARAPLVALRASRHSQAADRSWRVGRPAVPHIYGGRGCGPEQRPFPRASPRLPTALPWQRSAASTV